MQTSARPSHGRALKHKTCKVYSEKAVEILIRKIKIKVNRRFNVSNIILKIEVVYAHVKVVMRELKSLNI